MKKTTVGYHVRYEFKGVRDTYCHVKMTNKYVSKVCLTPASKKLYNLAEKAGKLRM